MKKTSCNNMLGICLLMGSVLALPLLSNAEPRHKTNFKLPKGKLDIYLLIGQSNMGGRALVTKKEAGIIERCYLLNGNDTWEPAKNPLNRKWKRQPKNPKMVVGPGYTFANAMIEKDKKVSLGLIVYANGGTSIKRWTKGTEFYKEVLRRVKFAKKSGTLKGILWHQGENDSRDPQYLDKLKTFVVDLRSDLGDPSVPFVAGQVCPKFKDVNAQIARLPEVTKSTGFVSSDGLKTQDSVHFDLASVKLLGQRYAEVMLNLQSQKSP